MTLVTVFLSVFLMMTISGTFSLEEAKCSRKCKGNNERNHKGLLSPYHCSCSPSCKIYHDCCHDSKFQNLGYLEGYDFMCLAIDGRPSVQAVSGCPPGQGSAFCESAIGHLPPVTSLVTNITYANAFCASCNEDLDKLVTWNVQLRCCSSTQNVGSDDTDLEHIFVQQYSIWSNRKYISLPCPCKFHVHYENFAVLDSLELRFCGKTDRIAECPRIWQGTTLERKCWSYEDPVYHGTVAFRNQHCAACNGYGNVRHLTCEPPEIWDLPWARENPNATATYMCNKLGIESCIRFFTGTTKGVPMPLNIIFRGLTTEQPTTEPECIPPPKGRCCTDGKRYDKRSNSCRATRRFRN